MTKLKTFKFTLIASLLMLTFLAVPAEASVNEWDPRGPAGGIFGLAQDSSNPLIIYSAGENGVFKSTDGGQSWISSGLDGKYIYDVALSPENPSTVLAGARLWGLYISTDSGSNWELTNVRNSFVYNLLFDSVNPNIVYAGAFENLYKSTDGGRTWESIFQPNNNYALTIALDPDDHSVIYTGTGFMGTGQGVYRYKASEGWQYLGLSGFEVYSLVFDPNDHSKIYAGTYGGALYQSTDRGETWERVGYGYPETSLTYTGDITGQYSDPVTLATSLDYLKGLTNPYIWDIVVDPSTVPSAIYAATDHGIYKSADEGAKWWEINSGLIDFDLHIKALLISQFNPAYLLAGSWHNGVFSYTDLGNTPVLSNRTIGFTLGSQSSNAITNSQGIGTATLQLLQPAGTLNTNIAFFGDNIYPAVSSDEPFTINKEDTKLSYQGDTIVQRNQTVNLKAQLSELDSYVGSLSGKSIIFTLSNSNESQTFTEITNETGIVVASSSVNLPSGLYNLTARFDGDDYYLESSSSLPFIIWEPMPGINVDGGGLLLNSNNKSNFGFTTKFLNNSELPQGQFEYIDSSSNLNIHSSSIDWLLVVDNMAWFGGNAKINGSGSHSFMVSIQDNGTPGISADRFELTLDGSVIKTGLLSGGNIIIH